MTHLQQLIYFKQHDGACPELQNGCAECVLFDHCDGLSLKWNKELAETFLEDYTNTQIFEATL